MFPISFHWNSRANGTMILNAMMWSPVGINGIQVVAARRTYTHYNIVFLR